MYVKTDGWKTNSKFCSPGKERAGVDLFPGTQSWTVIFSFSLACVLWLQEGFLLSVFSLTSQSQKMFHLSPAARNSLSATSVNETESQGSASVSGSQKHPDRHLQRERRPGGSRAVPPRAGAGGGRGRWQFALLTLTDFGVFYSSVFYVCIGVVSRRTCKQKGKHRKWNTFTGTIINMCFVVQHSIASWLKCQLVQLGVAGKMPFVFLTWEQKITG